MQDEDQNNQNNKKGFPSSFFLILLGVVLLFLAFQNYGPAQMAKVPFSYQLDHLVNLDLIDPSESRKVAINDSLVSYSGRFRQTETEEAKTRYHFLELLYTKNQLIEKRESLEKAQTSLAFDARAAAIEFLKLSSIPVPAKGYIVMNHGFDENGKDHSIIIYPKDIPFYEGVTLRQVEDGYVLATQLSQNKQRVELDQLRQNLSSLISHLSAPTTGIALESAKAKLKEASRRLAQLDVATADHATQLATYNEVIALIQDAVQLTAAEKNGAHLQDLRQVRSYRSNLVDLGKIDGEIEQNNAQLDKARPGVQDVLWYFGNRKLTTRQLEKVDPESYGAWFQEAKNAMESFESNKALSFTTPNEKRNLVIEENFRSQEVAPNYLNYLFTFLPIILLGVLMYSFFSRQMKGMGNSAMNFGKSNARLLDPNAVQVTFKDVAGVDEAKEELVEVVEFLTDPQKFTSVGAKIPKGILLVGPPGTGKTLLAKAVAGEAKRPFFSISGSDFVEMFVGVGASRIRDLFEQAKKHSPCIIFIDEIDAVGRHRGVGLGGGNDEREQTLNQLLVELDGIHSNVSVILIAATNRPDVLDSALLRPGRFDRHVQVPFPDVKGRYQIFLVHTQKIKLDPGVDLMQIAKQTPGTSGADIANIVNEGAIFAARSGRVTVSMNDLVMAVDKVRYGKDRRIELEFEERKATAYHEVGHTLTAVALKDVDEVDKVTITPKARSLGSTQFTPKERYSYWKKYLLDKLVVLMGGRVAEQMFLSDVSSGAQQDIEQATSIARSMVCRWGMSSKVGAVAFVQEDSSQQARFGQGGSDRSYSEDTARLIDGEVQELIAEANRRAHEILEKSKDQVEVMVAALLEFESLDRQDILAIIENKWDAAVKRQKVEESLKAASPKGPPPFQGKKAEESPKVTKPALS